MKISIGIVTFNRPACLDVFLKSLNHIDISVEHEVCILDNGSSLPTVDTIEAFRRSYSRGNVQTCYLSHNVGFAAGWNILENLMRGEYRVMMQDDTRFLERTHRADLADVAALMKSSGTIFMSISDCSEVVTSEVRYGIYSDWPHVEHVSLRRTHGDYNAYPRHYQSLRAQGGGFEPDFSERMTAKGVKWARYPKFLADHQRGGHSLMQTLMHEAGKLVSGVELDALWAHPTEAAFQKLGLKVWE
jgi:glycosyltransferase involved in cell wall biosynthesis